MTRIWPIIFIFFLFNSCFDQNDCLITSTNLVKVGLVTKAGVPMTTTFINVQQDSLGPDRNETREYSIFEEGLVGTLELPLDPDYPTSYYRFETHDSLTFTLALRYTTFSRLISPQCGAYLYYKDLSVVKEGTTFNNTLIVESQLFLSVPTNIKVFF